MQRVSAAQAVENISSGERVLVQGGAATPSILLQALVDRADSLRNVEILHLHTEGPAGHLAREVAASFRHRALFIGANAREAVREGRADYVPVFLSEIPRLLARGTIPVDTVLLNVSPPDAHGYCSLGTSVDIIPAAVVAAKQVIAQINARMPRTHGDSFLHVDRIHRAVEVSAAPHSCPSGKLNAVEAQIGAIVAELVPDGATLQLGIGAIPSAVALALSNKRDLGIHSEMFTDAIVDLVERGVITGAAKEVNRGKIVAAFVMGTERLYRFIDDNPVVEMRPADYTNDTALIRRFRRMIAINSAIEIDLTGQVCADSMGYDLYSGVGGQMDFIRGASMSEEGRAILAIPSTAKGGAVSRLVPHLREGAGVVTTRAHVHTVVTEYGVAELHGRSLRERARSLIGIAHPAFRDELTFAAHQHNWI